MKPIRAICLDCARDKRHKEIKIITTTAQLALHAKLNPAHKVEIIEAHNYNRKTGFVRKEFEDK